MAMVDVDGIAALRRKDVLGLVGRFVYLYSSWIERIRILSREMCGPQG